MANVKRKVSFSFERLDNERKEKKHTIKQMCDVAHKSEAWWKVMKKTNEIMNDDAEKLARYLDVNTEYLLGMSNNPYRHKKRINEVIRTCNQCNYCKWHAKPDPLECTLFDIEVGDDDYCSFGEDIKPDEFEWVDEPYEIEKERMLENAVD